MRISGAGGLGLGSFKLNASVDARKAELSLVACGYRMKVVHSHCAPTAAARCIELLG